MFALILLTALARELVYRTVRAVTAPMPPRRPLVELLADRPTQLTAAVGTLETTDRDARTLSGMVLPFGEVGDTSIGPVPVAADCELEWPSELRHVKLVDEHVKPPRSIGYVTAARHTDTGWRAAFHVGATQLGDAALLEASEGLRDGFSVELDRLEFNAQGELSAARINRVALVVTPAYPSARHDGLAAAQHNTGDTHMLTEEQRARLDELLAMDRTDEQNAELRELMALALGEDPPAEDPPAEDPPADASAGLAAGQTPASGGTARVPGSVNRGQSRQRQARDIRELFAAQARVLSGRSRASLEAALADITSTANIWVAGDEYAGQLWSGLEYTRRFVQNSTPGPLRSYKGTGWRWVIKPEVADYAGDKAAVPSNVVETEDTSWAAARLAGAHDLDRKFADFGDTEFIESYYAAMRESYAVKSDAKALAFQLASAVAIGGVAESSLFRAAAVAAQEVEDNTLGQTVDYFYINSADRLGLLDVTQADIPAYLEVFGVTPEKFQAAPGIPAGTVVAGTKLATKFRELTETPIRVEAINVANGGIDGGVFGYYATEDTFPGGVVSKTFA